MDDESEDMFGDESDLGMRGDGEWPLATHAHHST